MKVKVKAAGRSCSEAPGWENMSTSTSEGADEQSESVQVQV